jgi:hypothetical protein
VEGDIVIGLAVGILWLCIGIIILGAVIWILLTVIGRFFPISTNIAYAVWAVFGILILIYLLTAVGGAGGLPHPNLFR